MRQMDILGPDFLCSHNVQEDADAWFLGETFLIVEMQSLDSQTGLQTCSRTWKQGSKEVKAGQEKRQGRLEGTSKFITHQVNRKK